MFLLWTKGVECVKVLNALGPLCLWQCIKTNSETKFFWECYWNTLWEKIFSKCNLYLFGRWNQHSYNFKSNKLHSHFLSWDMWNTKTFFETISETFLGLDLWIPIVRLFYSDTVTETFLYRIKCFNLFLIQSFSKRILRSSWQKSRDQYVTLCSWWIECYTPMHRSWIEMWHTYAEILKWSVTYLCTGQHLPY